MIEHTVKKSYILIDTPAACADCPFGRVSDHDYYDMQCPFLDDSFRYESGFKREDCPLKQVELNIKLDI